ncbi:MAG: glycosyltransferase family 4 protein [Candidatus Korarchaeota archaeon]|nr:glycosyltransferase family 4 protein [Thermoproteota archaeon]
MKILNIQPFDYYGSIQRRSLQVALKLREEGIQTVFCVPQAKTWDRLFSMEAAKQGFKVYRLDAVRPVETITDVYSLKIMIKWLTSFPKVFAQLYKISKREQIQVIQINGLICIQEVLAMCILSRKKIIWVLISDMYPRFLIYLLLPIIRCVGKRVFVSRRLTRYYLGIKDDTVVYEPIDISVFDPHKVDPLVRQNLIEKFGLNKNTYLIVSVGNITPRKGFHYLIKAFAIVKRNFSNVKLLIIGDIFPHQMKYYYELKKLVKSLNLDDDVIFTGYIDHQELLTALSLADVFVIASLHEGTPVSILEAMAMERPVVATNVGGVSEQVISWHTGILVPPKNPEAIAKAIIYLLQNSNERIKMQKKARMWVKKMFSLEKCALMYKKLYEDVFNNFK